MGHYTTLTEEPAFKVTGMTWEEFQEKWDRLVKEDGELTYLDIYHWERGPNEQDPDSFHVCLTCDEYYAKYYSDAKLAEFISTVIAEGEYSILEYADTDGDGGHWGYYITRGSVKDIEYVRKRMVHGVPIDS
jgi:hypothetical protein